MTQISIIGTVWFCSTVYIKRSTGFYFGSIQYLKTFNYHNTDFDYKEDVYIYR